MLGHLLWAVRSMVPPAAAASLPARGSPGEAEVSREAQVPGPPWPTGLQASAAAVWALLGRAVVLLLSAQLEWAGWSPKNGSAWTREL